MLFGDPVLPHCCLVTQVVLLEARGETLRVNSCDHIKCFLPKMRQAQKHECHKLSFVILKGVYA